MSKKQTDRKYLEERRQDLNDLFEVSHRLSSLTSYEAIVEQVLLSLMGRLMIQKSACLLIAGEEELELIKAKGLEGVDDGMIVGYADLPEVFSSVEEMEEGDPLRKFLSEQKLEVIFPMVRKGELMGVLAFGKRLSGGGYEKDEISYISSLLSLSASAIENALVLSEINIINRGLDRKNQELQTLFELGKELNSTLNQETIVSQFGYALMGQLMVGRFILYLKSEGLLEIFHNKGFSSSHIESLAPHLDAVAEISEPVLINEHQNDWQKAFRSAGVAAMIPLTIQGENKGTLCLEQRKGKDPLTDADLQLLYTMGGQVIISLENARLFDESLEKQRLQEELNLAREIQQGLLTSDFELDGGWVIYGRNVPSREVGGDYFDVIKMEDGRIGVAIADVSGKGAGASLLMSNLQASLRALINVEPDLGLLVKRINKILYENTSADKFITFFIGIIDPVSRKLTFCNAGHNPPLMFSNAGKVRQLEEGGLIIGILDDAEYETESVDLAAGDKIVMYTDGITEAENDSDEEFGESRLITYVQANLSKNPEELVNSIIDEVKKFAPDISSQDDVTLLVLEA
ncbi:MAG: SpoIIE family protein phosphatase [Candidatus Marinimicrobia bacterium]|nr:SpoIIE family protein phosphatase [Candidatus Neomarinimicrobiota bacterium]